MLDNSPGSSVHYRYICCMRKEFYRTNVCGGGGGLAGQTRESLANHFLCICPAIENKPLIPRVYYLHYVVIVTDLYLVDPM